MNSSEDLLHKNEPQSVLIATTDQRAANAIANALNQIGLETLIDDDVPEILAHIGRQLPDLLFLDAHFCADREFCRDLCRGIYGTSIPVILILRQTDLAHRAEAFEHGISDYIVEPRESAEIVSRARNQLSLKLASKQLADLTAQHLDVLASGAAFVYAATSRISGGAI